MRAGPGGTRGVAGGTRRARRTRRGAADAGGTRGRRWCGRARAAGAGGRGGRRARPARGRGSDFAPSTVVSSYRAPCARSDRASPARGRSGRPISDPGSAEFDVTRDYRGQRRTRGRSGPGFDVEDHELAHRPGGEPIRRRARPASPPGRRPRLGRRRTRPRQPTEFDVTRDYRGQRRTRAAKRREIRPPAPVPATRAAPPLRRHRAATAPQPAPVPRPRRRKPPGSARRRLAPAARSRPCRARRPPSDHPDRPPEDARGRGARDRCSMYQRSSSIRSAQESWARPLIWAHPVKPGLTASLPRWRSVHCARPAPARWVAAPRSPCRRAAR